MEKKRKMEDSGERKKRREVKMNNKRIEIDKME